VPCAVAEYQCSRVCGKVLGCGRHRCELVCHAGACGGCPSAGQRRCPCGKVCSGATFEACTACTKMHVNA